MNLKKTLRPIKKKMLKNDHIFNVIRQVYTHLSDLSHQEIFDYYHVKSTDELQQHIEHIKGFLLKKSG